MDRLQVLISANNEYETALLSVEPSPERCLLAAVLARALIDLKSTEQYIVRDALAWFTSVKKDTKGFTFIQVMEILEFKPSQIALIKQTVLECWNDQRMCKRQKGGEEYSYVAKIPRRRVC